MKNLLKEKMVGKSNVYKDQPSDLFKSQSQIN